MSHLKDGHWYESKKDRKKIQGNFKTSGQSGRSPDTSCFVFHESMVDEELAGVCHNPKVIGGSTSSNTTSNSRTASKLSRDVCFCFWCCLCLVFLLGEPATDVLVS